QRGLCPVQDLRLGAVGRSTDTDHRRRLNAPPRRSARTGAMPINVCIAGTTGWTGSVVARHLLDSDEFEVVGALARREAGRDVGEVLGVAPTGLTIMSTFEEVLGSGAKPDVLIDYTKPDSVKARTIAALENGIRVVVGTSGLTAADYAEIEKLALA